MAAPRPVRAREPNCNHYGGETQPASACLGCVNRPDVVAHREQWAAWLAENPESEEAVYIREMDASQKRGNGAWWNDPVQKGNMFFSVADNLRYNRRNS